MVNVTVQGFLSGLFLGLLESGVVEVELHHFSLLLFLLFLSLLGHRAGLHFRLFFLLNAMVDHYLDERHHVFVADDLMGRRMTTMIFFNFEAVVAQVGVDFFPGVA